MTRWKTFAAGTLVALVLSSPVSSQSSNALPDMSTSGLLSQDQDRWLGDFYLRKLRGSAPIIDDPLLTSYINQLAQRLNPGKTAVHLYLLRSNNVNAFAFFGGNIVLNSALFQMADTESQLASVVAHEIAHVEQRHLMRAMEAQKRGTPLAIAGALGSALLAMANPQAGMAALMGTLASAQQGMIRFTQSNEEEADRIGIQSLQQAGFDPHGMSDFLQKLADQSRFSSMPPEILLTHPLTNTRLADARNRVSQMRAVKTASSQDYYLAKARVRVFFPGKEKESAAGDALFNQWLKGDAAQQNGARYGQALRFIHAKAFMQAKEIVDTLLSKNQNNIWYLDVLTDIYLGMNQPKQAIKLLSTAKGIDKEPVLQINLANALLADNQFSEAQRLLHRYTWAHPDDPNGWDLLAKASAKKGVRAEELAARAEKEALEGRLAQAINVLTTAREQVKAGSLQQSRYDARIEQLRQLEMRFRQYQNYK